MSIRLLWLKLETLPKCLCSVLKSDVEYLLGTERGIYVSLNLEYTKCDIFLQLFYPIISSNRSKFISINTYGLTFEWSLHYTLWYECLRNNNINIFIISAIISFSTKSELSQKKCMSALRIENHRKTYNMSHVDKSNFCVQLCALTLVDPCLLKRTALKSCNISLHSRKNNIVQFHITQTKNQICVLKALSLNSVLALLVSNITINHTSPVPNIAATYTRQQEQMDIMQSKRNVVFFR